MSHTPSGHNFAKVLQGVVSASFGPGVIGRIGTIARAGMAAIAVVAISFAFVNIWVAGVMGLLLVGVVVLTVNRAFQYADKFPEISAMDGGQITRLLAQQGGIRPLEGLSPPPLAAELTQNPLIEQSKS